jgi:hypothetical protein
MNQALTKEDIYIGDFLIEIYGAIESYKEVYDDAPVSVAVDTNHFGLLKVCNFGNWINKESMRLRNDIQIVQESRWNGSFMSMRGDKYKR